MACCLPRLHADLHFRVHVVIDGLPPFAWRPKWTCSWAANVRFSALMRASPPWKTPPSSVALDGVPSPDSEDPLVHAGQQRGGRPLVQGPH
ncbi:hypothetical protein QYE76_054232 [Lolium multiflorum]|uniref:Uncharacterized protein n=1 Tax=Lolium multiflorum TaxID=4521 RepID=A0AAD8SX99_LOLMU|nr:hypothetical protein QYE76_054232 [Lolium multiflorum]